MESKSNHQIVHIRQYPNSKHGIGTAIEATKLLYLPSLTIACSRAYSLHMQDTKGDLDEEIHRISQCPY
ncbi:hypothetical protein CCACVL1_19819 [Corchorus capsularis]|uniref:Uncharacterized protein n=1 Tax=Corchorus capsularis TaxID=210143 RepID=A0A1R3HEL9_COCAP|nr:hypothetical protein CCACVL1_19819 [Corchorus capsularis]